MDVFSILKEVPEYKDFLTGKEIDAKTQSLKTSAFCTVQEVGVSEKGKKIFCVTLGSGKKQVLLIGFPYSHEPVGALTIFTLIDLFEKNPALLEELDCTFHLIPSVEPDGAKLNEEWFKGFSLRRYVLNFYRTPHDKQRNHTFLADKNSASDKVTTGAHVIMKLIQELKPSVIYPLRAVVLGGVSFFFSEFPSPHLCSALTTLAHTLELPLFVGKKEENEQEMQPGIKLLAGTTAKEEYNDSVIIIAPAPLLTEKRFGNTASTKKTRREVLSDFFDLQYEHYSFLLQQFEKIRLLLPKKNPFYAVFDGFTKEELLSFAEQKRAIQQDQTYTAVATTAEVVHYETTSALHRATELGMFLRCLHELVSSKEEVRVIEDIVRKRIDRLLEHIEKNVRYETVPLRKLVQLQLGTLLFLLTTPTEEAVSEQKPSRVRELFPLKKEEKHVEEETPKPSPLRLR